MHTRTHARKHPHPHPHLPPPRAPPPHTIIPSLKHIHNCTLSCAASMLESLKAGSPCALATSSWELSLVRSRTGRRKRALWAVGSCRWWEVRQADGSGQWWDLGEKQDRQTKAGTVLYHLKVVWDNWWHKTHTWFDADVPLLKDRASRQEQAVL